MNSLLLLFSMTQEDITSLRGDAPATREQTIFKSVLDGRNEGEKKSAETRSGWRGPETPLTLLCEGSCYVIKPLNCYDFHEFSSGVKKNNKNLKLIISQTHGPLGSHQKAASRCMFRNSWDGTWGNKRGGTHLPTAYSPITGRSFEALRSMTVITEDYLFNCKIWYWPCRLPWAGSRVYLPVCHSPGHLTPPHSHWIGWEF